CLFSFQDTANTQLFTLSLHDALPIYGDHGVIDDLADHCLLGLALDVLPAGVFRDPEDVLGGVLVPVLGVGVLVGPERLVPLLEGDRKSTRLNSSHVAISYAVFCSKKK